MSTQLELWSPGWEVEPCGHSDPDPDPDEPAPVTEPVGRPHFVRLNDTELADLYRFLAKALTTSTRAGDRASTTAALGHLEREMRRRNIWGLSQPEQAPHAVETRYGHGLDHAGDQPRIIPGDHGQPPGRRRDLEPRTIHNLPPGSYL
ncbi:hypothetical protein ACWGIU_17980 [Streptomyces sp. NPDC054840]